MKIWKDKEGNKLTPKEFSQRFKEGISQITPIQKLTNEKRATFIMFVGYFLGLLSLIIYRKSFIVEWFTYALMIIFIGASWSYIIKFLALSQQLKVFKNLDTEAINLNQMIKGGKK